MKILVEVINMEERQMIYPAVKNDIEIKIPVTHEIISETAKQSETTKANSKVVTVVAKITRGIRKLF